MRLVYITAVQIPAGDAQSKQIYSMAKAFSQVLDFILITPRNKENESINCSFSWRRVRIPGGKRSLRNLCVSVYGLKKLKKEDIVYTRDIFVAWFVNKLGYKAVYEFHKPITTRVGRYLFRKVKKNLKIVAISGGCKDFLVDQEGVPLENVFVAHDGVDIQRFDVVKEDKRDLLRKFGLHLNKFIVMYCGSLYEGRGIEIILEMAKFEPDIFFLIVGGNKVEVEKWERRAVSNVLFLGRKEVAEIPYLLKSADLLCMPYTKNTPTYRYMSPLKLFEYMATGLPILASNIGSIPEVLNDNNAYLFDPENIQDTLTKLRCIRENYSEALEKAKQAYEDVKNNYTWDIRAKRILEFINDSRV